MISCDLRIFVSCGNKYHVVRSVVLNTMSPVARGINLQGIDRNKKRLPTENHRKSGNKYDLGGLGGLGVNFTVNFVKRIVQKLHRIILLQFGLVTFRFHDGRT